MKKSIIISIIVILIIVLAGVYFFAAQPSSTGNVSANSNPSSANSNAKVIQLDAKRWQYTPETITVKKGEPVKIMLTNEDTGHGISIPDFNVEGIESVEFTPDKTGTFEFHCPTYCGKGHKEMKGTIVVTD